MIHVHAVPAKNIRNVVVNNVIGNRGIVFCLLCNNMYIFAKVGFYIFEILAGGGYLVVGLLVLWSMVWDFTDILVGSSSCLRIDAVDIFQDSCRIPV